MVISLICQNALTLRVPIFIAITAKVIELNLIGSDTFLLLLPVIAIPHCRQWRLVPPLSEENKHFPVAFPIAFTSKKFVVIGNTEGVATIIGIQQYQNVLTEAYIATSHLINSYIIAIGI